MNSRRMRIVTDAPFFLIMNSVFLTVDCVQEYSGWKMNWKNSIIKSSDCDNELDTMVYCDFSLNKLALE